MKQCRCSAMVAILLVLGCETQGGSSAASETGQATETGDRSSSEGPATTGSPGGVIAEVEGWTIADPDADSVPRHRPPDATCELGFGIEDGYFEIDTELCNYALFEQPTLLDVASGQTVRFTIVHDQLYAEQPATAHLAFALEETIVYETEVPIPGEYALIEGTWEADRDVPAGTPLRLHLHNHGFNSWRFLDVKAQ